MLEMILDKYIIFVLMGGAAVCGILCKLIVSVTLKRLVKAAGNMNKSTHPLMRLVRAKFEHTCMISEKVENVRVFVDKYLYEYRVLGVKFHTLRRMECGSAGACLILGLVGAALIYSREGMGDSVLRTGAAGAGLAILVFLVHLMTDENYRLEMVRNYMVDYLENICLRRYEKAYQKEIKVMTPEVPVPDFGETPDEDEIIRPQPGREVPSPRTSPEITPPVMPEPYGVPDVTPQIQSAGALQTEKRLKNGNVMQERQAMQAAMMQEEQTADVQKKKTEQAAMQEKRGKQEKQEKAKEPSRDVLIRQILEEFMA